MTAPRIDASDERPATEPRRLAVAILLAIVFVAGSLLTALLPALAVVYLVVGFAVRDVVVVLTLWAASTVVTIVSFQAINRSFARSVLRRRIARVAAPMPSED